MKCFPSEALKYTNKMASTVLWVHVLDVVQDLLTVFVVLVEPGHDAGRTHQADGTERLPHRCLKDKMFVYKKEHLLLI